MVFSSEDKIFIKNLVLLKGYSSRRLIKEFPQKGRNKNGLDAKDSKNGQRGSSARQRTTTCGAHTREHCSFVEPGVKVNGEYYRNVLLMEKFLTAISGMSSYFFIFQQDSAPAHRAKVTIALQRRETPSFIGPEVW